MIEYPPPGMVQVNRRSSAAQQSSAQGIAQAPPSGLQLEQAHPPSADRSADQGLVSRTLSPPPGRDRQGPGVVAKRGTAQLKDS